MAATSDGFGIEFIPLVAKALQMLSTPVCTESALNRLAPHGVGLYDLG